MVTMTTTQIVNEQAVASLLFDILGLMLLILVFTALPLAAIMVQAWRANRDRRRQ